MDHAGRSCKGIREKSAKMTHPAFHSLWRDIHNEKTSIYSMIKKDTSKKNRQRLHVRSSMSCFRRVSFVMILGRLRVPMKKPNTFLDTAKAGDYPDLLFFSVPENPF